MLKTYLAVMLGGAAGTGLRMALTSWCAHRFGEAFPIGTMVVNVLGSLAIGAVAALTAPDGSLAHATLLRQVVIVGVLGGFTTFSSFSLQTLNLLAAGEGLRAGANVVLSVVLCLGAAWLGQTLVAGAR